MRGTRWVAGAVALAVSTLAAGCSSGSGSKTEAPAATTVARTADRYHVYWDENEEEDSIGEPSGRVSQLIAPWDPNGQLCVLPDGRFVVGYNPTLPSQHNPGSEKPYKQPPVGEALYGPDGSFTGHSLYVPGPYHMPGQTVGGDIPPDAAHATFNDNGTMTGCAVDHEGNVFATDLGTAQGDFPSPDDGRLIEWFAPGYDQACVVYGPTSGGVGPHHVDGHGGLRQPGDMAVDAHDDLYVPEGGNAVGSVPAGRVLRFAHAQFPADASECPGNMYPRGRVSPATFIQGNLSFLGFPQSIARDPSCNCWAVDTVFGDPAVAWFDDNGHRLADHATIPGESLAHLGDPNGYNPFGIAFGPEGTLYLVDIHIHCKSPLVGCGPASKAGRVLQFRFTNGKPDQPVMLAHGLDFPTSVTVCVPSPNQVCPTRGA